MHKRLPVYAYEHIFCTYKNSIIKLKRKKRGVGMRTDSLEVKSNKALTICKGSVGVASRLYTGCRVECGAIAALYGEPDLFLLLFILIFLFLLIFKRTLLHRLGSGHRVAALAVLLQRRTPAGMWLHWVLQPLQQSGEIENRLRIHRQDRHIFSPSWYTLIVLSRRVEFFRESWVSQNDGAIRNERHADVDKQ